MNRFSRFLRVLCPTCAVFVTGVAVASGHGASAKTLAFPPSLFQTASSIRDAFARVGLPPVAPASKPLSSGKFSPLLGSTKPSARGFKLAAAAGPNTLAFQDNTLTVGEGDGSVTLTVKRAGDLSVTTTVNYTTADVSATTPEDYTKTSGFLTFDPGVDSQQIFVPIIDDQLVEPTQSFTVTLSAAANTPTATTTINNPATVQIIDNEASFSLDAAAQTVNEGDGFADVTVTRGGNTNSTTSVDIATLDISATAPADYTAITRTLNFAPGDKSQTVRIPIVDDNLDEDTEKFKVTLSNPGASTGLVNPTAQTVTILDNDSTTVSFEQPTYSIGEGGGTLNINVTRGGDTSRALTVDYNFADGATPNFSATNGQDFTGTNGTITFAADQKTAKISVPITEDTLPENNEQFTVTLSNPLLVGNVVPGISPSVATPSVATVTIRDNDAAISFDVPAYSVNEGDGRVVLTVNRVGQVNIAVSVDYSFANGNATNGQDFTGVSGTLNFAANQTTQFITVPIQQDALDENDETFTVKLSNPIPNSFQTGPNTFTTVTIVDDDATPSVSIADVSQLEPDAGSTTQKFTVTLSAVSGRDVSVFYATSDGSATDGVTTSGTEDKDYNAKSGFLTIAAGDTSGTINIQLVSDTKYENDEGYLVTISRPSNVTIDVRKAVGTILNDDAAPAFSFSEASTNVSEGAGTASLSVTRTGNTTFSSSVTVSTKDGSAASGDDYSATTQTLTFAPNDPPTKTISIPIVEDSVNEATESFTATLSNPTVGSNKASLGTFSTETVTITDNDPLPTLSVSDASVTEGDSGTTNLVFQVTLDNSSEQTVTVNYSTSDGTALISDNDYVAQTGTLSFAPGETSGIITVVVNGDTSIENSETLKVNLAGAQNATISSTKSSGTGTILNDDTPPTFSDVSFATTSVLVNENEKSGKAVLSVTRTTGTDRAATIDFATADGTAVAGSDYTATSGTLRFDVGVTTAQISVPIINDTLQEPGAPESFTVKLSNPGGNAVPPTQNTATVSIQDDEGTPTLSVADSGVLEGNSGQTSLTYTVTLQPQSQSTVTVDIATLKTGTATGDTQGQDYIPSTGTVTLTFAPGVATQKFAVQVIGDTLVEEDETVNVGLSNPQGASISKTMATATGKILNDDQPGGGGTISFLSTSYSVDESAGSATITLGRSGKVDVVNQQGATVHVMTGNGTATPNSDYRPVSTTVTFAPGETTKSFLIPIINNTTFENDENVPMSLSNPSSNAILGSITNAVLTIVDDDPKSSTPRADSLSPTASVGAPFSVTATYSSDLGVSGLPKVLIQVGGNQGGGGLRAIYDTKSRRLSLDPTTGASAYPGSRTVLANQFGSLDCSQTTVERVGNSLRVTWRLKPTARTAQYVYIGATSSSGETAFVRRGTWRPSTGADTSANGS